ncbi:NfeD family protein [[Leptolyngbya] sp. PCC 7376]|uniref:NfeD family protein n=1 Tax=[Leptolyngbya] sp. PCC 7376 TaxID=111781 RepID=UPI001C1E586C|nr:hypothetical protein [[Leptolyngbya] sp. PCC 7376]
MSNEITYFHGANYGVVTESIALHQPGLILFDGRYYPAELFKPLQIELKVGTYVLVLGTRGCRLVVEKDKAIHGHKDNEE